jgi:hypothetical protein
MKETSSTYHKVTLDECELMRKSSPVAVLLGMFELVLANIQTSHMATSELHHLPSWSSHTTFDIEDLQIFLDADAGPKIVFVASYGLWKALATVKSTKVKRLAPGILIDVGGQVVVLSGQAGVVFSPSSSNVVRFPLDIFVIPVLEILIHSEAM